MRKISKEDREGKLRVWCLGAKEVVWSAVPHAQMGQGGGEQKNGHCIRVYCTVGVTDLEKSSFSGMWCEVCLELAQGGVGREVRAIEYGQLFRVFSRREME